MSEPAWSPDDILSEDDPYARPTPRPFRVGGHSVLVSKDSGRKTNSRFALESLSGRAAKGMPAFDHPAVVDGTTIYPSTVRDPEPGVLKPGNYAAKIGGKILKGKWKGFPVFTLTLEERATCPDSCPLFRGCYGNNMHLAKRYRHGPELERRIVIEIAQLARKYPRGFAIRLHILGDFYSVEYVELWRQLLARYRPLHVFGFTARWDRADPIAQALLRLAYDDWDRFAMRFSNAPVETCSTINIDHAGQRPRDAVICPAQLGKTESCSTCALCWGSERRIAFLRH